MVANGTKYECCYFVYAVAPNSGESDDSRTLTIVIFVIEPLGSYLLVWFFHMQCPIRKPFLRSFCGRSSSKASICAEMPEIFNSSQMPNDISIIASTCKIECIRLVTNLTYIEWETRQGPSGNEWRLNRTVTDVFILLLSLLVLLRLNNLGM